MANHLKEKKSQKTIIKLAPVAILFILLIGTPIIFLNYQSKHSGMSWSVIISRLWDKSGPKNTHPALGTKNQVGEKIDFLVPSAIGDKFTEPPQVSNVQATDLNNDSLLDVIVCDTKNNSVSWIKQAPAGIYIEITLTNDLIAPAHSQVIDFDKDGDKDILVAVLGMLFPNNDKIGSVVILENDGKCNFSKRTIIDKVARVSDVRAGDLDQDSDMDIAIAQFGYDDGETRWIENLGSWKFESHILQNLSGPINVEIVDIDKDNDLDIISLVSQEWEEIYCFVNDGTGHFQSKLLWGSNNEDFGSSGIYIADIDMDGDDDLLYTNGDAFDYIPPSPRPWHGVNWIENMGDLKFTYHRICDFAGAFNARPVDIDNDHDIDIFAISSFNFWDKPEAQSFIWLENSGEMQFIKHDIANNPTHLLSLEPGDFNNDGKTDFVTGGMHTYPPFDRMGRISLWTNTGIMGGKKQGIQAEGF